ncbi:PRC-barrel domain-containing protein [Mastigocladopsis repens]|uniref:PRC-barrel domain-containing protein n=1 Tax=Mastigocladopsis repens TaxID=221287 RepID=UPI0003607B83|nr:PRC-barrel domain-containing protein [Mastigocladopsis repens]
MALSRLEDFEASSRRSFKEHEFMHFEVYTAQEEKAGQVVDILVDEAGHFQYLVVDLNDGMTDKQVLLPQQEFHVDQTTRRVYLRRLNKAQVTELMAYNPTDHKIVSGSNEEVVSCSYPL